MSLVAVAASAAIGSTIVPADAARSQAGEPAGPAPYRLVWDDFRAGFDTTGPDAKWFYTSVGPYVGDDGAIETSSRGLRVEASGTNPETGDPAFVRTLAQDEDNGFGLPGALDHIKFLAYMNHTASTGVAGFDAVPGQELSCETWMTGRTYGTDGHPFGSAVRNPDDDLRLASVGMPVFDQESLMVFDFFVSNERIYAFYERLPYGRETMGNYAAFVHVVPIGRRSPGDRHHFKISYDRSAGTVRWLLDGREVFEVDRLGYRLDRRYLTLDHGGVEERVEPRQLNCGMGMFTILDGALPTRRALARLSTTPGTYYRPDVGEPTPQTFVDDESLESSRLFGQGASFEMPRYVVSSQPVRR
jgi:Family of unknown function (DUF6081)